MLMVNDYEGQDNVLEEKEKRWVYLTLTNALYPFDKALLNLFRIQ